MYVCMYFGSRMNRTVAECFLQHNDAIFLIGEPGRYCKREGGEREREGEPCIYVPHIHMGGRKGGKGRREGESEGGKSRREGERERGREGGKGAEGGREEGREGGKGREEREGREGREGGRKEGRVRRCATHCQEVST